MFYILNLAEMQKLFIQRVSCFVFLFIFTSFLNLILMPYKRMNKTGFRRLDQGLPVIKRKKLALTNRKENGLLDSYYFQYPCQQIFSKKNRGV